MKYYRFPLFILFSFITSVIAGQKPPLSERLIDSVQQVLINHKEQDSIKVDLLNTFSAQFMAADFDKTDSILNVALTIAKKINYKQGMADTYVNLASMRVRKGDFEKALGIISTAKGIQEKLNDTEGIIYSNEILARVYSNLNEPEKAIKMLQEGISLLENQPYSNLKASIHFNLANALLSMGELEQASQNFLAAKEIAKHNNFQTGINIANGSLGNLEKQRKNYPKALEYLKGSLQSFEETGQQLNIAYANLGIAQVYSEMKQPKVALQYLNRSIKIFEDQKIYVNLEESYALKSKLTSSLNDLPATITAIKNQYKAKDSILSIEKTRSIKEYQIKYETEKIEREKEAALKIAEINSIKSDRNKKLFIGTLIIAGLILLSGLFYFGRLKERKKAELIALDLKETQKRLALELQYRQSELKALKAQMDPHFIFNALNSIQEYIILNKKDEASEYLGKFSGLMRKYLHHSDKGVISIREEVDCLNIYLQLEQVRFEDSFTYKIRVDKSINQEFYHIPTMLIQPYVENAIKHGLLHKMTDRKLMITIKDAVDKIECTIIDNGVGRKKSQEIKNKRMPNHQSFATATTESRLNLLNYNKDEKIGIEIIDLMDNEGNPNGTKVLLTIPYIKR